jgi:hypothetical protein
MQKYLLAAHIGGAHFSVCLFDIGGRKLVTQTLRRIPVTYKAGSETIINVWKSTFYSLKIPANEIRACAVSVPLALTNHSSLTDDVCYGRYVPLRHIDIGVFFANLTGLNVQNVRLYHIGSSFLKGQLSDSRLLKNRCLTAIHVGTDFSAACIAPSEISSLNWEKWPFLNSCLNDYLSAQWLLQRYFQLTNISVCNVNQLAELYPHHPTVKMIFKEYFENMTCFLKRVGLNKKLHTIYVGGDLVEGFPRFIQQLATALLPAVTVPVKFATEKILTGTAELYFEDCLL